MNADEWVVNGLRLMLRIEDCVKAWNLKAYSILNFMMRFEGAKTPSQKRKERLWAFVEEYCRRRWAGTGRGKLLSLSNQVLKLEQRRTDVEDVVTCTGWRWIPGKVSDVKPKRREVT